MSTDTATLRYPQAAVQGVVQALLEGVGLPPDKAACVADALISADSMGHRTHGLALAPWYLECARSGAMTTAGEPVVVNDQGACVTWDGRQLPGAWLIQRAIDLALARVEQLGVVTVVIANSHHTGALAVYLPRLTARGMLVQLVNSSPSAAGVAPFGGTRPLLTPNPVAAGIPTTGQPILLDISASITTLNSARQLLGRGERFAGLWALDAQGQPTDEPAAVVSGGGSLLPAGGLDHGHKGYGWALLAEALTQGLAGQGRADTPTGTHVSIFLQVIDPAAFAGRDAFTRQTGFLADACRSNPPRPGFPAVRLPGEAAQQRQLEAATQGVPLAEGIVSALRPWVEAAGLAWPAPVMPA
jgi:LDH2 family malate/lactate/ureidoglycolate dehydrogenase